MNTKEVLTAALASREEEVAMYQLNINNFSRAIALIDATTFDQDMEEPMRVYRAQLDGLLRQHRVELEKSRIMLAAIRSSLEESCSTSS